MAGMAAHSCDLGSCRKWRDGGKMVKFCSEQQRQASRHPGEHSEDVSPGVPLCPSLFVALLVVAQLTMARRRRGEATAEVRDLVSERERDPAASLVPSRSPRRLPPSIVVATLADDANEEHQRWRTLARRGSRLLRSLVPLLLSALALPFVRRSCVTQTHCATLRRRRCSPLLPLLTAALPPPRVRLHLVRREDKTDSALCPPRWDINRGGEKEGGSSDTTTQESSSNDTAAVADSSNQLTVSHTYTLGHSGRQQAANSTH
jgi:hypothetical protein